MNILPQLIRLAAPVFPIALLVIALDPSPVHASPKSIQNKESLTQAKGRSQSVTQKQSITAQSKKHPIPKALREIEIKYARAMTLSAHFTQKTQDAVLGRTKLSSGTLQVKRPHKLRWQTVEPDPNTLIGDGSKYWFYTPPFEKGERGQVIVKPSNQVQSQLAHALLSGKFSFKEKDSKNSVSIEQKSPTQFKLTPNSGSGGTVEQAMIEINPREKLITKVTLFYTGGNSAEILLSKIVLGQKMKDTIFEFNTPSDTDLITQ